MIKKNILTLFLFLAFSFLYGKDIVVVIEKGDTLYGLSKKYKVSVSDILKKNDISDASQIKAGQKILIPQKNNSDQNLTSDDLNAKSIQNYVIKKGDTLFGLAKKFNINFTELLKLNKLTDKSIIKIGQVLKIPQNIKTKKHTKTATEKKTTTNKTERLADSKILWPVPATKVSYLSGKISGVVIDSKKGQSVKAITSGQVVSAGQHRGFGQVVFVRSKTKHIFVYGGLSKVFVKKGSTIRVGTKLGELGTELFTGDARLYFMVYNKNKPIDPAKAPRGF